MESEKQKETDNFLLQFASIETIFTLLSRIESICQSTLSSILKGFVPLG